MSTYRLDKLFSPRSVAVIGASPREKSPGRAVLKNLRRGGFAGEIGLVNPHYDAIEGVRAVKSFDALPGVPDLVVIAAPPPAVPALVATAGSAKGAVYLSFGRPPPFEKRNRLWTRRLGCPEGSAKFECAGG